jgi:hypothetical protein
MATVPMANVANAVIMESRALMGVPLLVDEFRENP